MTRSKIILLCFLIPLLGFLSLLWTPVRALVFSKGVSPETRGYRVAQEMGCFYCHGDTAEGGVPNPGAGKVPSLTDFAFLMSVHSEKELLEWILDGAPKRERDKPDFEEGKNKRALVMPAYRDVLSQKQLQDLLSWYHGVAGTVYPRTPEAEAGYKTALKSGCFSCHGPGGRFDLPNPGSLVGRIPAWHGEDFEEVAQSDDEIREWILDGTPKRLAEHPVASKFLKRQLVKMPAYRDKLTEEQVEEILAYIRWLRDPSAPGHQPSFEEIDNDEDEPTFY